MMNPRVEAALNEQIKKEASSSQYYLAMASWAENNGLNGTSKFMYLHTDEERFHMLKMIKFVNERGGTAIVPSVDQPPLSFDNLRYCSPTNSPLLHLSTIWSISVCKKKTTPHTILCSGMLPSSSKKKP